MRLQTRLILLIGFLLFIVVIGLAFSFERMLQTTVKEHVGSTALKIAKTVASMEEIRAAFDAPNPSQIIQPIVEKIRQETDAEFIVVGNREGIRYSHPIPSRIGKEMVGGDNGPVLNGESIVSEAVGSIGLSLRGKTPVFDQNHQVIGIVSVGFLIEDIYDLAKKYRNNIILLAAAAHLIGGIGAILIANGVKRSIHGLEPEEIGLLYQEKRAILETIHEGIIAINREGVVTLANQTASRLLDPEEKKEITGLPILDILPESRLPEVMKTGMAEFDKEMMINGCLVVVNRLPIRDHQQQVIGAVSSFRNKSELLRLTEELVQVKKYADVLRSQTHEYSNKLYTIYGLIQLESVQEAMDLITHETDVHQSLVHFLLREIPDPIVGGILIGKFNRANELKIELEIDERSTFKDIPGDISRSHLVTIIGNLVDNAYDAVLSAEVEPKRVTVYLSDKDDSLLIEVEDNGVGISEDTAAHLYEQGFSTKTMKHEEKRGFGLAIALQAVQELEGTIRFRPRADANGGTIFTVSIPKERGSRA